jgi:hypothetical protein
MEAVWISIQNNRAGVGIGNLRFEMIAKDALGISVPGVQYVHWLRISLIIENRN